MVKTKIPPMIDAAEATVCMITNYPKGIQTYINQAIMGKTFALGPILETLRHRLKILSLNF
jgi:hypothetical protein